MLANGKGQRDQDRLAQNLQKIWRSGPQKPEPARLLQMTAPGAAVGAAFPRQDHVEFLDLFKNA